MNPFSPWFIFPSEYQQYGLPNSTQQPDIDNLVMASSILIDQECGRTDTDGQGSLVYTTYQQRLISQSPGRNLNLLPYKPLVALTADTVSTLQTLGASGSVNCYYTGALPSVNTLLDGTLSAIISASGRYTYERRDKYPLNNDPYNSLNPLTILTLFGGPPQWDPLDMTNIDYDPKTGEVWTASGVWLQRYNEIIFTYTAGFDPRTMPRGVKMACAAATKNMMAKGSGTTGMTSFSMGRSGVTAQFNPNIIDDNIKAMLLPFYTMRVA